MTWGGAYPAERASVLRAQHNGEMPHRDRTPALRPAQTVRRWGNLLNLSTPLGLLIAIAGRAEVSAGPRGLILAEHYRFAFPPASAFTVGNVVVTGHTLDRLAEANPHTLDHEDAHAWQYLVTLGLPFLPLYAASSVWSWLRTGDWASANVFERHAGLFEGGYPENPITNVGFKRIGGAALSLFRSRNETR